MSIINNRTFSVNTARRKFNLLVKGECSTTSKDASRLESVIRPRMQGRKTQKGLAESPVGR